MKNYVVGFAFNALGDQVVLIRKLRPDWQAGKLNGVGGHIEPGETLVQAMVREFAEETGVATQESDWSEFALKQDERATVHVFRMFSDKALAARTMTDEAVEPWPVADMRLATEALEGTQLLFVLAFERASTSITRLDTSRPKAA